MGKRMARRRVYELLDRLAGAEDRFLQSEFLAPALPGGVVQVRLEGVVCRLRLDADFRGWGVFRPTSVSTAALVRRATLAEQRRYLELFPRRRVILCRALENHWLAWPAHHGDRRFGAPALLPVRLVEEAQPFDIAETRFDGAQAWFERPDARADPAAAAYLRQALNEMTSPEQVHRRGLSAEERAAYGVLFALRREEARDRTEDRLREALAHAGAELAGYVERADGYRVEYAVDGERHVSVVDKGDLSVQLAGICLSGEDRHFDLHSLVGVLREARGGVLRIGDDNGGMDEEQYWRVHPRR
jgi:hypothetical protein